MRNTVVSGMDDGLYGSRRGGPSDREASFRGDVDRIEVGANDPSDHVARQEHVVAHADCGARRDDRRRRHTSQGIEIRTHPERPPRSPMWIAGISSCLLAASAIVAVVQEIPASYASIPD